MEERGNSSMGRRTFLGTGLALVTLRPGHVSAASLAARGALEPSTQDSLAGRGEIGTLRDPSVVGRPQVPTDPEENAAEIQAIELRLACNCGCTLDVFTCRTTDFSCTYSPKLHREVLALRNQGKSAQQVIDAFVEKYGEKALMAPKPKGFNLAGYLVPGAAIATAGVALVLLISRRRAALAAPAPGGGLSAPSVEASPEELARLQRALDEVED
jgi:cytochrome c-type biogenesis protein CcmH